MVRIAPSILAANLAELGPEVRRLTEAGADLIHLDVMDGRFVPNLTFGPPVVKALRKYSNLPFDAHLMVENPTPRVDELLDLGVEYISFHPETVYHVHRLLARIRQAGAKAGLALNPATPWETYRDILGELDYVLLMSVNPGFAGQKFLPFVEGKLRDLADWRKTHELPLAIQIDGGVDISNAPRLIHAGADIFVAGAYVFNGDYQERIRRLKTCSEI
jgi:ribulose-phosphate 3-epimerase